MFYKMNSNGKDVLKFLLFLVKYIFEKNHKRLIYV